MLERIQGCRFHCPVIPESHLQYPGSAWLLNRGQTLSNIPKCYQVPPLCIFLLPVLVITSGDAYLVPNISRTQQQLRYLKTIARVSFVAPFTQRVTLLTFMANHRLQTPKILVIVLWVILKVFPILSTVFFKWVTRKWVHHSRWQYSHLPCSGSQFYINTV